MAASSDGTLETLELTADNIELVLDEVRPYLIADGGDVELVEIDGLSVKLKLKGACGSCPSSTVTMRMGIEKRLLEKIPDIMEVIQVCPKTWKGMIFRIARPCLAVCVRRQLGMCWCRWVVVTVA